MKNLEYLYADVVLFSYNVAVDVTATASWCWLRPVLDSGLHQV